MRILSLSDLARQKVADVMGWSKPSHYSFFNQMKFQPRSKENQPILWFSGEEKWKTSLFGPAQSGSSSLCSSLTKQTQQLSQFPLWRCKWREEMYLGQYIRLVDFWMEYQLVQFYRKTTLRNPRWKFMNHYLLLLKPSPSSQSPAFSFYACWLTADQARFQANLTTRNVENFLAKSVKVFPPYRVPLMLPSGDF